MIESSLGKGASRRKLECGMEGTSIYLSCLISFLKKGLVVPQTDIQMKRQIIRVTYKLLNVY